MRTSFVIAVRPLGILAAFRSQIITKRLFVKLEVKQGDLSILKNSIASNRVSRDIDEFFLPRVVSVISDQRRFSFTFFSVSDGLVCSTRW